MSDHSVASDPAPAATRRRVLHAIGLAVLTGGTASVVGGCSADGGSGTPSPSEPSVPATSAPPGSSQPATPSSPAPSSSARGASPSGSAVAAADIPVGGGVVLSEADYVITQPTAGDFRAFSKFCTHKQCPLASVGGGMINCMCHGGRYSMLDGSVQAGPPPEALPAVEVTVTGGWVVVTG